MRLLFTSIFLLIIPFESDDAIQSGPSRLFTGLSEDKYVKTVPGPFWIVEV